MSDVPTLNASLQQKQQRDYDPQLDVDVRKWVSSYLDVKLELDPAVASFGSLFRDGVLLCRLINKIKPGVIPEPARTSLAFKQMVPYPCNFFIFFSFLSLNFKKFTHFVLFTFFEK